MESKPKIDADLLGKTFHRFSASRYEMIFPNVYPNNWGECDLLALRKSRYVEEIEVKISVSDFKADFKKVVRWKRADTQRWEKYMEYQDGNKHEAMRDKQCFPNRFSFLVHPDIIDKIKVPDYAGLITVGWSDYFKSWELVHVKDAPLLHKVKITEATENFLLKKLAYRFMDSWSKVIDKA